MSENPMVEIDYTNWRGERRNRVIEPMRWAYVATDWHPEPQWICWAKDDEDGKVKAFAMAGVHGWKQLEPPQ